MAVKKPVYRVAISEHLIKNVYVEAWTPEAAEEYVQHLYCDTGELVLTADDYQGESDIFVDHHPVDEEPEYFANDDDSRR